MFCIQFISPEPIDEESGVLRGHIVAGELDEDFQVGVTHWNEDAYRSSWCQELGRLVGGAETAVLMTVAIDPADANWLRGYVLYRFDAEVRIQERMFIVDDLHDTFDLSNPSASVGAYESVDDDGMRISQWVTPLSDIELFWTDMCQQKV